MGSDPENQPARPVERNNVFGSLVEISLDAAVKAFMVVILGNIALSLVGGIAGRMIPSAPPGFSSGTEASPTWTVWWIAVKGIKFYLVFAVLFFFGFRARFTNPSPAGLAARASRGERARRRFADNWFGSLVGNAFLAMAMATVLVAIPNFTFWHWFWHWIGGVLKPGQIVGEEWMSHLRPWFAWYDHNQLKFNFWVIYVGAVCDDLGLPNLKSLTRWIWRRYRSHKAPMNIEVVVNRPPEKS